MSTSINVPKIFIVEKLIEERKSFTYKEVLQDLKNGFQEVLYYAKQEDIDYIIKNELIDEDISSIYETYQEEMRFLKHEFLD